MAGTTTLLRDTGRAEPTLGELPDIESSDVVAEAERLLLPLKDRFLAGARLELAHPHAPLPGANDWSATPCAAHPRPVVLVHGTGGGMTDNWLAYGPLLYNEGYTVYSLTYGNYAAPWPFGAVGGLRSIREHGAPEVAAFTERVLDATGADQVDYVTHSQGSVVAGWVAKKLLPGTVGSIASLAPLWDGTGPANLTKLIPPALQALLDERSPLGAAGELIHGSKLLRELWSDGTPYASGVQYTNIVTRYDEIVMPYTSGIVDGENATNIVVQDGCPKDRSDHLALAGSRRAADFVLNALDPDNPRAARCESIVPIHGRIRERSPRSWA
ncbi:esterase/lipase family protein [Antrihabitans cavernicola]|uniref:Alpha/beta fold hydrolase n=1 Tax=Antrihabitans cavernicola TaxID=2495913 RepID=A0A5A7SG13_9NOCA|nr:alpha/beta fold hydrolase [Spelaeibacter cavernicola]KAA0023435.1 alpha/beta fold hydrolase [Spelaeibacter cavernicola]